jgi:hypothetical protein
MVGDDENKGVPGTLKYEAGLYVELAVGMSSADGVPCLVL